MLGSPQPSAAACSSALPSGPTAADASPLQSATSPRIAMCCGGWSANCSSASSRACSECLRARSRRELRRFRVTDDPAENGLYHLRAPSEHVVVETLGEVERDAGVLERSHVPAPEACRPREPGLDDRLQRRPRGCLAQSVFEERDGAVDALELG